MFFTSLNINVGHYWRRAGGEHPVWSLLFKFRSTHFGNDNLSYYTELKNIRSQSRNWIGDHPSSYHETTFPLNGLFGFRNKSYM
jgi:hypothetical protein